MKSKCSPPKVTAPPRGKVGWVFFTCLLLLPNFVSAQSDSLSKFSANLNISIETANLGAHKIIDTLDVLISTARYTIAGMDMKIGFDSYAMDILEVLRGELPDSCQWEFFDTKASIDQGKEGYPRSIWQVVMLSGFIPDSVRPICYSFKRPVSIARLVVQLNIERARIMSDTLLPIYFFWEDCSDNTVTNVSGDSLMMSIVVDGVSYSDSLGQNVSFPTRFGTPTSCIKPKAKNKPMRRLVFHSGGMRIGTLVD